MNESLGMKSHASTSRHEYRNKDKDDESDKSNGSSSGINFGSGSEYDHNFFKKQLAEPRSKLRSLIKTKFTMPDDKSCKSETCSKSPSTENSSTYESKSKRYHRRSSGISTERQVHNEIEKRRRDKMNKYILELSAVIPKCSSSIKVDKLTVLRLAVEHLKNINKSHCTQKSSRSFLSEPDIEQLISQTERGFLFVVGCTGGHLAFVSESIRSATGWNNDDLVGHSFFDILHPKDVGKVKEQLATVNIPLHERPNDGKAMFGEKSRTNQQFNSCVRISPGSRRSFFCRIIMRNLDEKYYQFNPDPSINYLKPEKKYFTVYCSGYIKSMGFPIDQPGENLDVNGSYLIAIGHLVPISASIPSTFISRLSPDGKFSFIEEKATMILGYLSQELVGTYLYDYCHPEDLPNVSQIHKELLELRSNEAKYQMIRFQTSSGYLTLHTEWKLFLNPWTKEVESIFVNNTPLLDEIPNPKSINHSERANFNIEDVNKISTNLYEAIENEGYLNCDQTMELYGPKREANGYWNWNENFPTCEFTTPQYSHQASITKHNGYLTSCNDEKRKGDEYSTGFEEKNIIGKNCKDSEKELPFYQEFQRDDSLLSTIKKILDTRNYFSSPDDELITFI